LARSYWWRQRCLSAIKAPASRGAGRLRAALRAVLGSLFQLPNT